MLMDEGIITEDQLREALDKKKTEGGFLGKLLIDMGFLDEHTLINFLVKQFKIPHINLMDYEIAQDVLRLLPKEVCIEYNLVPIDKLGKILTIAMVDPLDVGALDKVRDACPDVRIKPILCSWRHFEHVMRDAYPDDFKQEAQPPADDSSLSMESLGLSGAKSPKKKAAQPKEPAPPPATAWGPAEPPSAEAIHALVDETLHGAIGQAVEHIADRVRDYVSAGNGEFPVTGIELAARVRTAIAEASELSGATVLQATKQALDEAGKDAGELSVLELSHVLQNSMRRALQGATSEILEATARSMAKQSEQS